MGWLVDYLCYLILKGEDQRQVKQRTPIQTIQLENVMRKKYEENGALIARAIEEAQQQ
jgi:lambda repressor-like predicted transcriptional regulator